MESVKGLAVKGFSIIKKKKIMTKVHYYLPHTPQGLGPMERPKGLAMQGYSVIKKNNDQSSLLQSTIFHIYPNHIEIETITS